MVGLEPRQAEAAVEALVPRAAGEDELEVAAAAAQLPGQQVDLQVVAGVGGDVLAAAHGGGDADVAVMGAGVDAAADGDLAGAGLQFLAGEGGQVGLLVALELDAAASDERHGGQRPGRRLVELGAAADEPGHELHLAAADEAGERDVAGDVQDVGEGGGGQVLEADARLPAPAGQAQRRPRQPAVEGGFQLQGALAAVPAELAVEGGQAGVLDAAGGAAEVGARAHEPLRVAGQAGVGVGQAADGQLAEHGLQDVLQVSLQRGVELPGALGQQVAVGGDAQVAGLPVEAADLPGVALLVELGAHAALQRHRLAADRQGDAQVRRVDAEGELAGQAARLQVDMQEPGLDPAAGEVHLAVADADALDGEGGAEPAAPGPGLEQRIVEGEDRLLDLQADRLAAHEQRRRRQVDVDAVEGDQVAAADREVLDAAHLQPQGEEGKAHVAKANGDGAVARDQPVHIVAGAEVGAATE